ncbi:MAG: GC-type dockerin domain-anchored protein [Planctomycetota bacterium]|nr:GC-type dockerin domain-anchored protein [Planctomycetota bacterium]
MKRAPLLLSCAIVATTTIGSAADVQNEDFIFESFMFDQLYPLASDGERLLVEDPWPGVVHLAVFSPEGHSGDDWLPDSIIKIPPDEPGCDSWLEKAALSGDHAALLLWDEDQESYSTRLFFYGQEPVGQWNDVMSVTNTNTLPPQYEITDMELHGPELVVAFANQDTDAADSGALVVYHADGDNWSNEYTLEMPVQPEPSVYVGGGNWMRFSSGFSVKISGDTMIVTEAATYIQDITYTWLNYPIVHTYHHDANGMWQLQHSMRFQPGCAAEMMMDEGAVWVDLDFKDNRMVLLRHQECTSQDYPWLTSEAVREYTWNEGAMNWSMINDPFDMPAAHQVTMLDAERVVLQHADEGVHEFRLENGTWSKTLTYEPSNPELTVDALVATDSILFASTYVENDDLDNGPVLGFELDGGGNGADIDGDGTVGVNDVLSLIAAWGSDSEAADINGDGIVDVNDLLVLLQAFEG